MSASIAVSAALQRTLTRQDRADPDRVQGYLTGAIKTKGPSRGPHNPFAKPELKWARPVHKRRARRRMLGGSSGLPDTIRHHYTEGERAALWVIGQEAKRQGWCALCLNAIADRAGVGRTTVQNAIRRARQLGHVNVQERPQRGRKNLTNIIRVALKDWLRWLKKQAKRVLIGFKEAGAVERSRTLKDRGNEKTSSKPTFSPSEFMETSRGQRMRERAGEDGGEILNHGGLDKAKAIRKEHGGSFFAARDAGNSGPDVSLGEDKFES